MDIKKPEGIILRELSDSFGISGEIQHITLPYHHIRRGKLLIDSAHEPVLTAAATHFQHIQAIIPVNIQFGNGLAYRSGGLILDMHPEKCR